MQIPCVYIPGPAPAVSVANMKILNRSSATFFSLQFRNRFGCPQYCEIVEVQTKIADAHLWWTSSLWNAHKKPKLSLSTMMTGSRGFTYIRSKDKRSNDKRSNDQRPKDKRSNDKRSKDKRSNDKRSKDKRSKRPIYRQKQQYRYDLVRVQHSYR